MRHKGTKSHPHRHSYHASTIHRLRRGLLGGSFPLRGPVAPLLLNTLSTPNLIYDMLAIFQSGFWGKVVYRNGTHHRQTGAYAACAQAIIETPADKEINRLGVFIHSQLVP